MQPDNLFAKLGGDEAKRVKRTVGCGTWILGAMILLIVLLSSVGPYTEWLWYVHDARQPRVFNLAYEIKGFLFSIAFFATWLIVGFSLSQSLKAGMVYAQTPSGVQATTLSNLLAWAIRRGPALVRTFSAIVALIGGAIFSEHWLGYLAMRHAVPFGVKDPIFGLDLAFFVFRLPWWRAIADYTFGLLLLTTALTIGLYLSLQALASLAKIELTRPQIRAHLHLLVGMTLLVFAARAWLSGYEIGLARNAQFTGAGFVGQRELVARWIFSGLLGLAGLFTLVAYRARSYRVPLFMGGLASVVYVLGGLVFPAVLQRVYVDPDKVNKEAPFAEKAIRMTRYAYGLDQIEARDFETAARPTDTEIRASQPTLEHIRLWDPEVMRTSLERLQGLKSYYTFHDVDVDRYEVEGQRRIVMLSPRDINLNGLSENAQNWNNLRLRYTHGYGVAMAQVTGATSEGQPLFLANDIPQRAPAGLQIEEPRIYFSDDRDAFGNRTDEYAIVRTKEEEFSYPTEQGFSTTRWKGDRGVPIGGLLTRVAFSVALGDRTLLFAGNVTGDSRLLVNRNVVERCHRIYPFLKFDDDPYIVIFGGKLLWILDAYTTTAEVPYSEAVGEGPNRLNYIRNSVKVTIDAYTGETRAYAVQPDEPILRVYRNIYPSLVLDLADAPPGLDKHWRYPEDLFKIQCAQLTNYHVLDPIAFLGNSEAWQLPFEQDLETRRGLMHPYYVLMQIPGEREANFMLILPFTPLNKPNMSGWLAAECDPGRYGKLTLFKFSKGTPVDGPELMETNFNATPEVSNINRQYRNDQSEIVLGNLLVMPLGKSVMYVEPMFLRSKTAGLQAAPRLFKVILALQNKVVVADDYQQALDKLFGSASSAPQVPQADISSEPGVKQNDPVRAGVRETLNLLRSADAALKAGDFAKYGELQKQARVKLEQLSR